MTNRLATAERTAFGLVAWLEQTRVPLPLKGVDCRFAVTGDLLHVEIDQVFHQDAQKPLDVTYSFPLPSDAAIYRCEMLVNERLIRARVEERAKAVALARQKKAEGRRTALAEMERDNLFTLSLGNLQPGDLVVIRLAYFQTLTRLEDWTSFSIPFCPGVRYIPGTPLLREASGRGTVDDTDQVPDASRITPPRIDQFDPEAAFLAIHGRIDQPVGALKDISSPSHPVVVKDGDNRWTIALADNAAVPDRDFVLRWTEIESAEVVPSAWLDAEGAIPHALLRLKAPASVEEAARAGQDYYFLVDRSGSMAGLKWQKAVQAFQEFLKVLGPQDRVWATFFETSFRDVAEKPLPAATLLKDQGVRELEHLGADGGTELLPALSHVVQKVAAHSTGASAALILITDGQVGNEHEILKLTGRQKNLKVHTFGIDTAVNEGFLKKLASQSHGSCCLLSPDDDIVGAVVRLGKRLGKPVLTNITVEGGWELPTETIPDLHAGEVCLVPLRRVAAAGEVVVTGQLAGGRAWAHKVAPLPAENAAFRLLWARQRIEHDLAFGRSDTAIRLAKEVNLVCEGTAFVAWDEAEKVTVATQEVYQPSVEPAGMVARMLMSPLAAPALAYGHLEDGLRSNECLCCLSPQPRPEELEARKRFEIELLEGYVRSVLPDQDLQAVRVVAAAKRLLKHTLTEAQLEEAIARFKALANTLTDFAARLRVLHSLLAPRCGELSRGLQRIAHELASEAPTAAKMDAASLGRVTLEYLHRIAGWHRDSDKLRQETLVYAQEAQELGLAIRKRLDEFLQEMEAVCKP